MAFYLLLQILKFRNNSKKNNDKFIRRHFINYSGLNFVCSGTRTTMELEDDY